MASTATREDAWAGPFSFAVIGCDVTDLIRQFARVVRSACVVIDDGAYARKHTRQRAMLTHFLSWRKD